eukprot:8957376-Karenia_brevis.AAC.1
MASCLLSKNQRHKLAAQRQKDTIARLRRHISILETQLQAATDSHASPSSLNANAAIFVPSQFATAGHASPGFDASSQGHTSPAATDVMDLQKEHLGRLG